MKINIATWIKISLFNLLLVAALGLLMRYKIAFELPFISQKNVQHSHSHFAFSGWVTQTLFVLLVAFLAKQNSAIQVEKYTKVFIANLSCAYIMLFSFIFQGYGLVSILFSTLSLFVSFWFAFLYFKDLKLIDSYSLSKNWFQGGLVFNILSSIGTFGLAYMMATKNLPQDYYLSSIYFYLHFQYNGWFWFACMGLFMTQVAPTLKSIKINRIVFKWFFLSCIPAFLLSILWLKMPTWLYLLAILSAIVQVVVWIIFIIKIIPNFIKGNVLTKIFKWIYLSIFICASLKLFLQLGSTIPSIGKLAFGFRPIVIAYLHLVLLAVISGFLLVYLFTNNFVANNRIIKSGLIVFIIGIFLNEFVLAIQGVASFSYTLIPHVNLLLLGVAFVLFFGAFILFYFNLKKEK